jgi:hypothetical protein
MVESIIVGIMTVCFVGLCFWALAQKDEDDYDDPSFGY